jgi:uncharacterized protein YrzB (UPF0473 family)
MEESNRMTITDESGQEREIEIILTFDDEAGQSFVLFQDPNDAEDNVYAYKYDEDGNMNEVTDEKEWDMCQEVLGAFMDEESTDE